MAARKPLLRQSDLGPPIFFGVFTFTGVLFIIIAKSLRWDPVVVTGVPVVLMLGYAVSILLFRRLRLRDDQTGDNFYYMGFIFTLTSLALSLIQFSSGADVNEIVVNFGVAVASTIAGIVLRIFFNLVRRDPIEVEHVARLELSDASRRVRLELDNILIEMAHFRRTNQQMLAEGFDEIRGEVKRSAEAATAAVEAVCKVATEQSSVWAEGGGADRIRAEIDLTAKSLAELNQVLAGVIAASRAIEEERRRRNPIDRFLGWFRPADRPARSWQQPPPEPVRDPEPEG